MKTLPVTLAACTALCGTMAQAQEASSPFSVEFSAELQNDLVVDSSTLGGEFNNFSATIEGAISYALTSRTSLNSSLTLEQITPPIRQFS